MVKRRKPTIPDMLPYEKDWYAAEKRITELEAELSKIESILPDTYYADKALPERVELMVKSWQKLIPLLSEAEARIAELEDLLDATWKILS